MNQSQNASGMVPEARGALDNMKFEIARELGINFKPVSYTHLTLPTN